jgi:hypothetical protein
MITLKAFFHLPHRIISITRGPTTLIIIIFFEDEKLLEFRSFVRNLFPNKVIPKRTAMVLLTDETVFPKEKSLLTMVSREVK